MFVRVVIAAILALGLFPVQNAYAAEGPSPDTQNVAAVTAAVAAPAADAPAAVTAAASVAAAPAAITTYATLPEAEAAGVAQAVPQDTATYEADTLIVAFKSSATVPAGTVAAATVPAGTGHATPAELLKSASDDLAHLSHSQSAAAIQDEVIGTIDNQTIAIFTLPADVNLNDAMLVLANNSVVASVQPDFIYNVINDDTTNGDATNGVSSSAISPLASSAEANDPLFGSQWNLRLINAPTAWNTSRANHKVIVAVLDTGARLTHVDLKNNLAKDKNGNLLAWDATDGSYSIVDGAFVWTGKPLVQCPAYTISPGKGDPQGHGTIVAGVIAAQTNNSVGIAGVSYNADLLPIRVIAQSTSTRELVSAYDYMIKTKAAGYNIRVANISFIVFGISSDSIFHKSIIAANKAGILTVAAAGNNNSGAAVYPSDWPEVLSVVAVDANKNRAVYSNYNSSKDLAAPGGGSGSSVLSLGNATDTSYVRDSGTSVAAPHVSAAAAILFALDPSLTPAKAKSLLCSTARDLGAPGYDPYFGYGLLDVNAAVLKVLSGFTATAAPKITAQPVGSVYYAKQAAKALKVVASTSDGGKLTYQWYSNSKNSTAGATAIKGATAASYLPPTTKAGATYYYCVVTNTKANTNPGKKTLRSQIVLLNIAPDFNQQVVMLVPDAQTGLRLEFGGQSVTAGKQASLWASNGGPNQRYYLVRTAGGLYKIKSVNSNLYLTVSGKVAKEGAAIVQAKATGGQEQQFRISYQASGKYTLTSALNPNFVVAVKGASPVSGALIVLQKRNTAAKTQVFRISTIKPVIASGTVVAIQDFNSGRFLDVAKGSKADGASFLTNAPSVALSERYTLTYNAKTGYYKIVPLSSAKPVTIKQAQRYTNGTAVFQYKPISGFNQQWDVRQRSDGKYVVYQPSSRQALTDSGGINHKVVLKPYTGAKSQCWVLIKR